ncbi:beta-galactosidase [Bacteroides fragilis]|uniref:beta-galactosidase n=1 Tax=Bacteroides fragilis TaxID=817 RepID=UPI001F33C71B|nr:beta-galactosidase [Bacteroides fragilis]MCE8585354.1 beta-galactosidase [Bacteroides fragilis]MCE8616306.1 beta-galactosidase [Bacteroides fragilis]MCE8668345.1 beta-galactosidase [Bacteroides fragilis]MCZ2602215.1 beta-galactosidase [Bacteroides fragilis]UHZ87206.1 beta-galactosidase [Bacteroides fragilis]
MKNKCILKCVLFALVAFNSLVIMAQTTQQAAKPEKKFLQPERVRYDGSCMTIEGKDIFIYSAAFHYFRCPEELWRDRFRQIKEAGFNTVETYVPWNWHERIMPSGLNDNSHFDFSDVKRWLKMAQEEFGLYTIVRPGPFICAEYSGGGYPRWLAKFCPGGMDDFWLRSADHRHISWSQHWFDAVCKALADEQITRKPVGEKGIILIQIENEYNHHGCYGKEKLLKALYQSVRKSGMDIPIFTCLTNECRSSEDVELSQVFDSDNYYVGLSSAPDCAYRMANLRKEQPDAPGFVTELQGGWFSLVTGRLSEDHYSDARHFKAVGLMSLLGGAGGINYYMFFGGTHFAGWGARGMTTSYDYNAAIRENGARSDKYFEAKAIGQFIQAFEPQLVRSEGGPCAMEGGAKSLFGGVRVAVDGTRFVFLHNTDPKNAIRGKVRLLPGKMNRPATPMYNINQHGEKVLIAASEAADTDSVIVSPINVSYDLPALGTKVLVIPAGKPETKGEWWPQEQIRPLRPAKLPQPVRIASALKKEDAFAKADWKQLPRLVSLPDLGVNDFRYSLYRAQVSLTSRQIAEERFLLFNMFTRDIVSVAVNGKQAKRLFPDKADAQSWTTRDCFKHIRPDEYDNRFDVSGLLKEGDNEILVVYENLGHAHGYVPMEELSGIREAGLSLTETALTHPLEWEYAADAAGVAQGWNLPQFAPQDWQNVSLDVTCEIPAKGNGVQPKAEPDGLFTWYRIEFELPGQKKGEWIPWLARINASGNGYMWLNGNNIGRHWEAGPQREFFLPECWLNFGGGKKNVLVIGLRQTANGAVLKAMEIAPYRNMAEIRK